MEKLLKVGTTFSGIGAPEQALKNLGIPHVVKWACDIDAKAKHNYLLNHHCEKFYDDILAIDIDKLEGVDLYVFGFPCQDISCAGKQDLSKGRSTLVFKSIQIINKLRPKYFLWENVPNLKSAKFAEFFAEINAALSADYNYSFETLNAKDFGSPQSRKRLFGVGIRKDLNESFSFPVGKHPTQSLRGVAQNCSDETPFPAGHKFYSFPFRILKPSGWRQYDRSGKGYDSVSDVVCHLDNISPALRASGLREPLVVLDDGSIRSLCVDERKLIQGFPLSFKMDGTKCSNKKQLGNTMCVNVVQAVFKAMNPTPE